MDFKTGRANHIEDYLVTVRDGQWFGWSDAKNKVYANIIENGLEAEQARVQAIKDKYPKE